MEHVSTSKGRIYYVDDLGRNVYVTALSYSEIDVEKSISFYKTLIREEADLLSLYQLAAVSSIIARRLGRVMHLQYHKG